MDASLERRPGRGSDFATILPKNYFFTQSGTGLLFAHFLPDRHSRKGYLMDIVEKFQDHAAECRLLARFTRDPESKRVWNRMADRWLTLAMNEKARSRLLGARARRMNLANQSRAA